LLVSAPLFAAAPPPTLPRSQQARLERLEEVFRKAGEHYQRNEHAEAQALIEQALPIERELFGVMRVRRTNWVGWLAERYEREERFEQASRLRRDVVAALALLGADHWRVVEARWYRGAGERLAALSPEQRRRLSEAQALFLQGGRHSTAGRTAEAHRSYLACLDIRLAVLGEKHPDTSGVLNNLAATARDAGDWRSALSLYRRAVQASRESLGPRHLRTARVLANLAGMLVSLGDPTAVRMHQESLAIRREVLGESNVEYQLGLQNLAVAYHRGGKLDAALTLYREVLEYRRRRFGENATEVATVLSNLGILHIDRGELAQARPLLERARDIRKARRGEKHPEYGNSLNNLGGLLLEQGDARGALELFAQGAALRRAGAGERSGNYATSLRNMAAAHQGLGQLDKARSASDRSLEIIAGLLALAAGGQSERQQLALARSLRHHLNMRLSLGGEADLYPHVLAWKGAVLLRQQQQRRFARLLAGEKSPAARALLVELEKTTRRLAAASTVPMRQKEAERLMRDKEDLERRLADLGSAFRSEGAVTPDLLRRSLPADAVLVDFLFYTHQEHTAGVGRRTEGRLLAWVLRRDRPPVRIELGGAKPIEKLVADWREAIEHGGSPDTTALARCVWQPLEKHVSGARTILVSPDASLACFSFAALPGSRPGRYLVEEVALVNVPAPQLLPALLTPRASKPASLLVVGDVAFEEGKPRWKELPATRSEVAAVAAAFRKRFGEAKVTSLVRHGATRAALREAVASASWIHLATHGFFTPINAPEWSPLLGSGVVLAGAEGTLTALEVAEMDLAGCELAVLSACETGLGALTGGEGLLGLQRALQVAGCKRVIGSLWSVEDAATSVLMERFYYHLWEAKAGYQEALRAAQLDVLRQPDLVAKRREQLRAGLGKREAGLLRGVGKVSVKLPTGERRSPPAWWAGFTLSGDWR
jgi:CHAT domain-containing protein